MEAKDEKEGEGRKEKRRGRKGERRGIKEEEEEK